MCIVMEQHMHTTGQYKKVMAKYEATSLTIWQKVSELQGKWNTAQVTDKGKLLYTRYIIPVYYISHKHYHTRPETVILSWHFSCKRDFVKNFFPIIKYFSIMISSIKSKLKSGLFKNIQFSLLWKAFLP